MFIDVHCHIDSDYYSDKEIIIKNAYNNNVKKLIYNGCNMTTNKEVIKLINLYEEVFGAIGFHPTELDSVTEKDYLWLEENLSNNKIVAIGEIGLDYHYENTNKDLQKTHFRRQLSIAEKYKLPVIIHSRDSIQDTYDILKEYNVKGILHCYSGSLEMAREFIKIGFLISVGGVITFKNSKNIVNVIKNIPLEYITLETDSPYLSPEPFRGRQNEPKNIPIIASKIASIKEISIEEVAKATTDNASRLFDI